MHLEGGSAVCIYNGSSVFVLLSCVIIFFFFSSRRRHTRYWRDWSSDVCSSDLVHERAVERLAERRLVEVGLLRPAEDRRLRTSHRTAPPRSRCAGRGRSRGRRDRKSVV